MKKQEKKFVLAALALLAITGLLALAGCKNDTVPEPTPKYTVSFNTNGGSTVASQTVESGQKATRPATDPTLEGSWFLGWYSDEGLANEFDFNTPITDATTVYAKWSYKLHTEPSILTNYTSSHAPEGEWTYVEFGDWPQTILKGDVEVYETKSKEMGMFTYYLGSDGNHYVKAEEKACEVGYKYSDGSEVKQKDESGSPSTRWFKVEPIVWRVLTEDYKDPDGKSTGNALLLAEKILTGGIKWADSSNKYKESYIRQWLNGNSGTGETSDYNGDTGFLQTAFTQSARELIADTTVDNSAASTNPASDKQWNDGKNEYASDTPTTDKVFLLSEAEATTGAHLKGLTDEDYGFDEYSGSGTGNTRIRVTTDYAKATGAYQGDPSAGYGGWWWLRSPSFGSELNARGIKDDGDAGNNRNVRNVFNTNEGVVPALSISLK